MSGESYLYDLEVLVCTYGVEGLRRALEQNWPKVEGVQYLVCCQAPEAEDELLVEARSLHDRGDTLVLIFRDKGLSVNRNHAFAAASAPFLLIMDDDVRLEAQGLCELLDRFMSRPELDYMTLRVATGDSERRVFPPKGHDLSRTHRFYHAISFEIAVRRSAVERHGLKFSTLAGIGAPHLGCGEEDLLLRRMRKAGLRGEYSGIEIGRHDGPTTNERSAHDPRIVRAKGTLMHAIRGPLAAAVRLPLEAYRSKMPFFKALGHLIWGYFYYHKHRGEL